MDWADQLCAGLIFIFLIFGIPANLGTLHFFVTTQRKGVTNYIYTAMATLDLVTCLLVTPVGTYYYYVRQTSKLFDLQLIRKNCTKISSTLSG